MHTFSFARNRALRNHKQRVVSTFSILAVVLLLALSPVASAQHTADQPSPRVGPARKGRPSAKPAAKPAPPPKPPAVKRAALQNFEQKVQPDGSIVGVPVELEMGVSETTEEIMARQAEANKLPPPELRGARGDRSPKMNERRKDNPQNPESVDTPSWPMIDTSDPANQKTHTVLNPQTLGTSFTAATLAGTNSTLSFPPDTMGAVGPTQFITAVNGRIVSFNKSTGVADGVINATQDTFFNSVRNGIGTSDPRIRYDRLSSRWFVIIINVSTPNRVLIAVSNTSTITLATVWTYFFFQIDTVPPAISSSCLFDYPTLGIDANALYIGGNNFCPSFNSCDGFVVRKSSILGAGPIVVTAFRGLVPTNASAGPYTPQGVDNFDAASTEGYFIGVDNLTFGTLMIRRVSTPGGTPTISGDIAVAVTATQFPVKVKHSGNNTSNGRLDALDDRLFAAHIRNGRLWTAHNIGVNNTGTTAATRTRNACRWYELQNVISPGVPSVLQSGTLFDPTAPNDVDQLSYWIPSIMVSGQGHAAMGFSRAGDAVFADAYTCGRLSIDTLGTMQAVTAITAATNEYTPMSDPGGLGGRRWGDYSYTSLDPLDDMTMWTTQQFTNANDSYGVRVTRLNAPPPPTPQPTDPDGNPVATYPYPVGQSSFNVTFLGTAPELAAGEGYYDPGPGFTRLAASVTGGVTVNSVTWIDRTRATLNLSSVGASQGLQTVTFTNPDGQQSSAAVLNLLAPNAVGLASLTATRPADGSGDGSVTVAWTTGFEVDNLGFNVYRENSRGQRVLVTPRLVAGSALVSSDEGHAVGNRSYTLTDRPPGRSTRVRYWLEDIDRFGHSTMHGPIRITRATPGESAAGKAVSSLTLDELGQARKKELNSPVSFTPEQTFSEWPESESVSTAAQPPAGLGDVAAVKMTIRNEGWYAVPAADFAALGLNLTSVDPRNLQLYAEGRQIPMLVTGEADGRFDPADRIEFYGLGLNLPSTDARVCWLVLGSQPGLRMRQLPAPAAPALTGSFPFTVESRDRIIYFSSLRNGATENFFGQVVSSVPVDQQILLRNVDRNPLKKATIDVGIQGVTTVPHRVAVTLNGQPLGEVAFTGATLGNLRTTIASDALVEGINTVRMTAVGTGFDISLVGAINVTYFHQPLADDNLLRARLVSAGQGGAVTLAGFGSPDVRVVDVTSPAQPVELLGTVGAVASGHAVSVRSLPGARTLLAFGASRVRRPDAMVINQPSALRASDGADLLIVSPRDLIPSLAPLVAARRAEGLTVAIVDLEDAFDEFSFGVRDPRGLQAFIGYALDRWPVRPRYILLVGDGTYDPRDYFGNGPVDRLPTQLYDSRFLETASDEWFADRTGDGVADAAIGRLPVRTPAECAAVVAKILAYGSAPVGGEVVLVSDIGDTYDFHAESQRVRALVPSSIPSREIERAVLGDAATRTAILAAFNAGPRLLSWNGHGSVGVWRGDVLTSEDVVNLTNGGALPIVTTMTCLNGYFTEPTANGLSEELFLRPGGGAVAVWSSTAMTAPEEHTPLNAEFYRVLFANPGMRVGDAIQAAKGVAIESDTRRSWSFLGDPSMRARLQ